MKKENINLLNILKTKLTEELLRLEKFHRESLWNKRINSIEEKYISLLPKIIFIEDEKDEVYFIFPIISFRGNITYCLEKRYANGGSTTIGYKNIKQEAIKDGFFENIKEEIIIIDYLLELYWFEKNQYKK